MDNSGGVGVNPARGQEQKMTKISEKIILKFVNEKTNCVNRWLLDLNKRNF